MGNLGSFVLGAVAGAAAMGVAALALGAAREGGLLPGLLNDDASPAAGSKDEDEGSVFDMDLGDGGDEARG